MQIIIRAALALSLAALASCKIVIAVGEGGTVVSQSGAYQCTMGNFCTLHVYDIYFDETFEAVPAEGYQFAGWRKDYGTFCGGRKGPCRLSTTGFPGNPGLIDILESDQEFYLQPMFLPDGKYQFEPFLLTEGDRVVDASGDPIGYLVSGEEQSGMWEIGVYFEGINQMYLLTIQYSQSDGGLLNTTGLGDIAYLGKDCQPDSTPMALLGAGQKPIPRVYYRSRHHTYIPDPFGDVEKRAYGRRWKSTDAECGEGDDFESELFPLAPTNLTIKFPLRVDGTDIVIRELRNHPV